MKIKKCYANLLGNCSGKISGEHFISAGILRAIGPFLEVSGFPWLKGKTKKLSIEALQSKILCEHHNSLLSELDTGATSLFTTINRFDKELDRHRLGNSESNVFSGHIIERWLVKMYLGMHCGGSLGPKLDQVEQYLLNNLFNDSRLPADFGLYFGAPLGTRMHAFKGVAVNAFITQSCEICAIACEIAGIPFYLSIRPLHKEGTGKIEAPAQHHPFGITFQSACKTVSKGITFTW